MSLKKINFIKIIVLLICLSFIAKSYAQTNINDIHTEPSENLIEQEAPIQKQEEQEIRIELRPVKSAMLASALSAKIIKLPFKEGERFKEGDLLVEFDCALEKAELDKAKAIFNGTENQVKVNNRLKELNSISKIEYTNSLSMLSQAKAEVDIIKQKIKKCTILAPYSGIVSFVKAREFENSKQGAELLTILDDHNLEVELRVPSKWLQWLKTGALFSVDVIETNKTYNAQVIRIGANIDPISQSIKIIGSIKNTKNLLKPGMSGNAKFRAQKQQ